MKKILSLFLILTLSLFLLTACCKTQDTINTSNRPPTSQQTTAVVTQVKQEILNQVIVQRGKDSLRVGFQNDSSDKLRTLGIYGLVSDVENLLWIASRGSADIDPEGEKIITELPVIQESSKSTVNGGDILFYDDVKSKNVWIRLNYKPFIPSQGTNIWGHKDLIVYLDPDNHNNAFLGIENAQKQNTWNMILLPGYGPWLEKEIDILLRLTIAM